ncbi:MAG: hypothetical protein HY662_00555, partial [Chloroflexi bacterium]|nr:hypothetical protein [Chloroflexota bacterium]
TMITGLLFDILFGTPFTISREILSKLRDEIDRERLITEESIKQRLQQLQLLLQDGKLGEAEYDAAEIELIERLKAVRDYQQETEGVE